MSALDHMSVFQEMVNNPEVRKFVVTMRDAAGKEHHFHLTGPESIEHAEAQARSAFFKFTFVGAEEVFRGPLQLKPVPEEAFTLGIKKEIQKLRRR